MDDRIIGSFLIIFGLFLAGFGGTMSSALTAIYYIVGFLIAFIGIGFFLKYRKSLKLDE
ncbi:MAG: hypothetical protein ACXACP_10960 [Candidatus Hodarchaeales archaeon]|jgi:hypothetical protein